MGCGRILAFSGGVTIGNTNFKIESFLALLAGLMDLL